MKYEWEDEAKKALEENYPEIENQFFIISDSEPQYVEVIGVIVRETEAMEGAVIRLNKETGIDAADCWKDAVGDMMEIYAQSVKDIWPSK